MAVIIDGTNGITAPNVFGTNVIINGNFAINQRGVSGTVTLAAGVYGHDRFKAGAGGCTYTFATSQNVTTLTITAGTLIQVIEGANLLTDTYTLTFTGTAQGKIGAGSFSASGVTGSVTGGTNLNVEFNTGTVSLVQLERGTVATPFEFRSIGQELGLCQRYFETTSFPLATFTQVATRSSVISSLNNNIAANSCNFVVPKRVAPTVTLFSRNNTSARVSRVSSGLDFAASATANLINNMGFSNILLGGSLSGGELVEAGYKADAEL